MHNILIIGAGKIGKLITCLLANTKEYRVFLVDQKIDDLDFIKDFSVITAILDVNKPGDLEAYIKEQNITVLISSLPYYLNKKVASIAKACKTHYFDLTEDTSTTDYIRGLAKDAETAFVPQCGLAPGFISIAANSLMQEFEHCKEAKLRVGALPKSSNHALKYALTWSVDGLINEYGNLCVAVENGQEILQPALEALETIQIDGSLYEAFNTSGGLGSLALLYKNKVDDLNYKTIRYPGHCEKIKFLMNDLNLNHDRETLKRILENSLPTTVQDLVITYVSVTGFKNKLLTELSDIRKIYPQELFGRLWSAIQISTAAGICAIVDLVLSNLASYKGFVLQEQFSLKEFLNNRFGQYYKVVE